MAPGHVVWVNHYAVGPRDSGGTRHFELGRALTRLGWRVTIVASDFRHMGGTFSRRHTPRDRSVIWESTEGVQFAWLWSMAYSQSDWRRAANWLSFAAELTLKGRNLGPASVVVGSTPDLFAALGAYLLSRRLGAPFILEVRDLWPESLEAVTGRRGLWYYSLAAVARFLYARAARVIVLARGAGDVIVRQGVPKERIAFLPNGIDPATSPQLRRPPHEGLAIVYAGAHGPANGLDAVLGAAQILLARKDIRFMMVGDGPEKPRLQALAVTRGLKNVEFRDPVPKSGIPSLLSEADAGLMVLRPTPLFAFGVSPNKLFDYLGAALPVVSNVPGDVASMLDAARAGETASDGGPAALARAIERLAARSQSERDEMGRLGREWVLREHDRTRLAGNLGDLLGEVAAG